MEHRREMNTSFLTNWNTEWLFIPNYRWSCFDGQLTINHTGEERRNRKEPFVVDMLMRDRGVSYYNDHHSSLYASHRVVSLPFWSSISFWMIHNRHDWVSGQISWITITTITTPWTAKPRTVCTHNPPTQFSQLICQHCSGVGEGTQWVIIPQPFYWPLYSLLIIEIIAGFYPNPSPFLAAYATSRIVEPRWAARWWPRPRRPRPS